MVLVGLLASGCAAVDPLPVFEADFEQEPQAAGWSRVSLPDERADCDWIAPRACAAGRWIVVRSGGWQSPPIKVVPFQYYSLRLRSMVNGRGYWAAEFYDERDEKIPADHYCSVDGAGEWVASEFCFQGKAGAVRARILFRAQAGAALHIDDVTVRPVNHRYVARCGDRLYKTLPPLNYTPAPNRWTHIGRTIEKLRAGRPLTVVMLGDSIINDTGNSGWETLVERHYGSAGMKVITSTRGGGGCGYYRQKGRVKQYVLDYHPDLVIIGGISHGYEVEPIRDVVRQVRAGCDADILVMTGPVTPEEKLRHDYLLYSGQPREKAIEKMAAFPGRLRQMAADEKVEFLDMRAIWQDYVKRSGKPDEWFLRDVVHANARGHQALARILERYFSD